MKLSNKDLKIIFSNFGKKKMNTISNYSFAGKKAIIRVDFNVPLTEEGKVADDTRIRYALPTIEKVIKDGGIAILMSHLGRPKGKRIEKLSLRPVAEHLSELINKKVYFVNDSIGEKVEKTIAELKPGDILLLENLRFYKEETEGNEEFARKLASLADVYINDAFGTAHRAHASTSIIAKFFDKENKMFGFLMEKEIEALNKVMKEKQKPFTAIIGGAKISTKIGVIKSLLQKVDNLIIGGAMTFTFIKAQGGNIGASLYEQDMLAVAQEILSLAQELNVNLILPIDSLNGDKFASDAMITMSDIDKIPNGWMGLDIGPKSIKKFGEAILQSKTILWNGPVGVFEFEKFANGTKAIGQYIAQATEKGAYSLIGGGDTLSAVNKFNMADKFSYISTGGGALLEYIEGKELPGIKAILE